MKILYVCVAMLFAGLTSQGLKAQTKANATTQGKDSRLPASKEATKNLFIDVHHFGPGKVNYNAVAEAHQKDLKAEKKYNVDFLKFWVDEQAGTVYCLSSAPDSQAIRQTHKTAHGLLPDLIYPVSAGQEAPVINGKNYYLDIHELGAGNVTAKDVAGAHQKDLAVQAKYGVNFINYWVNEKDGRVVCLSQAADSADVIKTHKEAHGLVPVSVEKVQQGQ